MIQNVLSNESPLKEHSANLSYPWIGHQVFPAGALKFVGHIHAVVLGVATDRSIPGTFLLNALENLATLEESLLANLKKQEISFYKQGRKKNIYYRSHISISQLNTSQASVTQFEFSRHIYTPAKREGGKIASRSVSRCCVFTLQRKHFSMILAYHTFKFGRMPRTMCIFETETEENYLL